MGSININMAKNLKQSHEKIFDARYAHSYVRQS